MGKRESCCYFWTGRNGSSDRFAGAPTKRRGFQAGCHGQRGRRSRLLSARRGIKRTGVRSPHRGFQEKEKTPGEWSRGVRWPRVRGVDFLGWWRCLSPFSFWESFFVVWLGEAYRTGLVRRAGAEFFFFWRGTKLACPNIGCLAPQATPTRKPGNGKTARGERGCWARTALWTTSQISAANGRCLAGRRSHDVRPCWARRMGPVLCHAKSSVWP
ncbi:hypothetical protein METBIDRAFT_111984 [Metschnikowia bicuspidata var. bicuspidata NRRL YB-4993]|uniref:Uncharacterized protein n=1 Tax=Metschnikowia bicuspidata var. bicuspidata NRRL YB-4993 TaxID=869754 RepID=A0A1A0HIL9_9ASCO|nr:hypothetical protein METBIDRAFT_111984 [Metschnikowia bicuspidata var. bicuspidata NRRL YB-4993]OBA23732.1 hypothetical protein METBIDRAFT_111984 [Metschnikowia bicuspidata var. bicuspidata NRRL YB-4993]